MSLHMPQIIRNRTIRPSSRLETSKNYKIDTKAVERADTLIVNIDHESKPFQRTYHFEGNDVADKASISFRVVDWGTHIEITWSGANPIDNSPNRKPYSKPGNNSEKTVNELKTLEKLRSAKLPLATNNGKKSGFQPIVPLGATILILGTLPGDVSMATSEYYANRGNRFWQIISSIAGVALPTSYEGKKGVLDDQKIALWDVLDSATRAGSMDHKISNVSINDLEGLLRRTPTIKMIAFNGTKAAELFNKYHTRVDAYQYIVLPSSSGANTHLRQKDIVDIWDRTFARLK